MSLNICPRLLAVCTSATILLGCASAPNGRDLLDERLSPLASKSQSVQIKRQKLRKALALDSSAEDTGYDGFTQVGDDRFVGASLKHKAPNQELDAGDITLNLANASIPAAAQSVLGETLGLSYSVDARFSGSLTIETPEPVSASQLLAIFEAALRDAGAGISVQGANYRIVPLVEASRSTAALQTETPDSA